MDILISLFELPLARKWNMTLFLTLLFLYNVNCFEYKVCDTIGSFVQFENKPFNFCVDECSRRQRCKIFMFRTHMNYCAIKEEINITSLQDGEPRCSYYTREEWLLDDLGPCRGQPCNVTERCYSKTETEYECVKSECTAPEQIQNARSLSNMHSIGSTNRYKCSNGFKGQGNPTIKCLEDATWSTTDFECVLPDMVCPQPQLRYHHADLTEMIGRGDVGTVLTYTCRNGFQMNGAKVSITCLHTNLWHENRIYCCHDNSTHFLKRKCVHIVNGGIVGNKTEAEAYCKELGGWLTWVENEFVEKFDPATTQYILQSTTMDDLKLGTWFRKCADLNGVTYDPDLTLKEMIDTVRNDSLVGPPCYWGHGFVLGQPDFQPEDDCIFRDMNKRHSDGQCSFPHDVGFVCQFYTTKDINEK